MASLGFGPSGTGINYATPWGEKPGWSGFAVTWPPGLYFIEEVIFVTQTIPAVKYAYIGGSGTWAGDFPLDIGLKGVEVLEDNLVFQTPYGETVPLKLLKLDKEITADHKDRLVLSAAFHGWHSADAPANGPEQIFWVFMQAGVKNIVVEGSGGGINTLLDPGDLIIPSDYIDMRKEPTVALIPNKIVRMLDPFCPTLRDTLYQEAQKEFPRVFNRGVRVLRAQQRLKCYTTLMQILLASHSHQRFTMPD